MSYEFLRDQKVNTQTDLSSRSTRTRHATLRIGAHPRTPAVIEVVGCPRNERGGAWTALTSWAAVWNLGVFAFANEEMSARQRMEQRDRRDDTWYSQASVVPHQPYWEQQKLLGQMAPPAWVPHCCASAKRLFRIRSVERRRDGFMVVLFVIISCLVDWGWALDWSLAADLPGRWQCSLVKTMVLDAMVIGDERWTENRTWLTGSQQCEVVIQLQPFCDHSSPYLVCDQKPGIQQHVGTNAITIRQLSKHNMQR
jgi:hypothetical protein